LYADERFSFPALTTLVVSFLLGVEMHAGVMMDGFSIVGANVPSGRVYEV
jgi:hypothetical protein